jgi:hypothetical protein
MSMRAVVGSCAQRAPAASANTAVMIVRFISFLLVLYTLALLQPALAQTCDCPEFLPLKAKWEAEGGDSKGYYSQLRASANKFCVAKSYEWQAYDYMEASIYDSSDFFYREAERLFRQTGCSDSVLVRTYKFWAQLYFIQSDFGKAQEYSFKLLKAAELSGNPEEIGNCYTMIAHMFNQTGQAEKGVVYSRKAIPYLNLLMNPVKKSDLLYKLSKRYLWYYQDTKAPGSLDTSEMFSYQQLEVARSINRRSAIAAAFNNFQGFDWERGDLKKALV